jgi:Ca2+-binding EF-hand superfamily protein
VNIHNYRALQEARLRKRFATYDLNHDGRLTLGEFIRFLRADAPGISTEDCELAFVQIDRFGEGAIEFEPLWSWWVQTRPGD